MQIGLGQKLVCFKYCLFLLLLFFLPTSPYFQWPSDYLHKSSFCENVHITFNLNAVYLHFLSPLILSAHCKSTFILGSFLEPFEAPHMRGCQSLLSQSSEHALFYPILFSLLPSLQCPLKSIPRRLPPRFPSTN